MSLQIMSLSHWITLQEFLPNMINKNHGHVVSVASAGSYMALPQMGAYTTTKASALALHEVLAGELRARYNAPKVRTTVVCPTKVNTALGGFMGECHFLPSYSAFLESD
jgi:all-trans-retinol dehydrogenase (NAD+)